MKCRVTTLLHPAHNISESFHFPVIYHSINLPCSFILHLGGKQLALWQPQFHMGSLTNTPRIKKKVVHIQKLLPHVQGVWRMTSCNIPGLYSPTAWFKLWPVHHLYWFSWFSSVPPNKHCKIPQLRNENFLQILYNSSFSNHLTIQHYVIQAVSINKV